MENVSNEKKYVEIETSARELTETIVTRFILAIMLCNSK